VLRLWLLRFFLIQISLLSEVLVYFLVVQCSFQSRSKQHIQPDSQCRVVANGDFGRHLPLFIACEAARLDNVLCLLEQKCDVHARVNDKNALNFALKACATNAEAGLEIFRLLMGRGTHSFDVVSNFDQASLQLLCRADRPCCTKSQNLSPCQAARASVTSSKR